MFGATFLWCILKRDARTRSYEYKSADALGSGRVRTMFSCVRCAPRGPEPDVRDFRSVEPAIYRRQSGQQAGGGRGIKAASPQIT